MKQIASLMAAGVLLSIHGTALAQSHTVTVAPGFSDGVHTTCAMNFDVVFRDHAYQGGDWVQAAGSFNLYNYPDRGLMMVLKLGLVPLEPRDSPAISPATAYFVNAYSTNAAEALATFDSESVGYRMFGFSDGEQTLTAVARMITDKQLNVGYTLAGGQNAQQFTAPLSDEQSVQWSDCLSALLPE